MIKYSDALSYEDLQNLFDKKYLVYVIRNFHQYENLNKICHAFVQQTSSSYEYQDNLVSHVGNSSYEIDDNVEAAEKYYSRVAENYQFMQDTFSPALTPMEHIEQHFKKVWQPGFEVENFHGKKMFAGLVRVIHQGSAIHAHQDLVAWSNPKAVGIENIKGQFGLNYFLKVPNKGGRLLLWDQHLNQEEFYRQSKGDFCISVDKLPPPDVTVKPEVGMLVLLNSHHLHAIEASIDSHRIASSCFIAYREKNQPLTYWT